MITIDNDNTPGTARTKQNPWNFLCFLLDKDNF